MGFSFIKKKESYFLDREIEVPLGPREVRVMVDNCLQASMFLRTASSRPDKCLCPSFNIDCIPYGCIENPIVLSLFFYFLSNRK
jgi:hypothetical protein